MTQRYFLSLVLLLASALAQAADMNKIDAGHLMRVGFTPIPSALSQFTPHHSPDNSIGAPHFIVGGKIKGGLTADNPPALRQQENDNSAYATGLRNPYPAIRKKWRRLPPSSMPGGHLTGLNTIRT